MIGGSCLTTKDLISVWYPIAVERSSFIVLLHASNWLTMVINTSIVIVALDISGSSFLFFRGFSEEFILDKQRIDFALSTASGSVLKRLPLYLSDNNSM